MTITREVFLARAHAKHGLAYLYTAVVFLSMKDKVQIICPQHGDFWQTPSKHCCGDGCPECGRAKSIASRTSSKHMFVENAKKVHGDTTYDYSHVEYVTNHVKVEIQCRYHTAFWQAPSSHLSGSGCPICYNEYRSNPNPPLSRQQFVDRAREVHGTAYDYTNSMYVCMAKKVSIRCIKHDFVFQQLPVNHIFQGSGCPKCSCVRHSQVACDWLDALSTVHQIDISHAQNGGEHRISETKFKVDGFCAASNTV